MTRTKPPFRADVVGSLLRTAPLKEARAKREKGEISAAALKEVEDREIEKIIKKQEDVGLKVATDGEFRRSWWHFDFFGMLDGVEIYRSRSRHSVPRGADQDARTPRITGKLGFSSHPMLDHFKFLKAHTRVTPKMTIPSPAMLHFGSSRPPSTTKEYADRDAIFDDLAKTYQAGHSRFLRRRLPLPAIRRHRLGLSLLAGGIEEGARARTERGASRPRLCRHHQPSVGGQARRYGGHDPRLPRQFPLDLDLRGRLRSRRRGPARGNSTTTAISSNTTPSAPADSSRCAFCQKATRSSCLG